ncbi:MAG TPA: glutathione S-transferase N-terminal domain-containing protein [Polyangiaceae bacterium]|nr:glutathione S-transferase N-terminal domain-containing protein [Polyangiaceae bacterium]
MKIYGDPLSTNTRKVLTTLAELETPYELVHVDFAKQEQRGEAHLARQPFGQMPALDDEGFALYETHAMCRYLDARAGGRLMPTDLRSRALVDQWMSIESANFSAHAMKFVYHYLLRIEQDSTVLAHAGAAFEKALGVLAKELSARPFIGGQAFTLADICYMPYFEYALLTPAEAHVSKHPSVLAWWSKVRERASWRKVSGRAAAA